jgi:hypothetical protein
VSVSALRAIGVAAAGAVAVAAAAGVLAGCRRFVRPSEDACAHVRCPGEARYDFDVAGLWDYGADCAYVAASDDAVGKIGLPCVGKVRLCAVSATDSAANLSWADEGAGGDPLGEPFPATGYSAAGLGFFAFGERSVPGAGCRVDEERVLACRGGASPFACEELSLVRASDCAATSAGSWLKWSFTFARESAACDAGQDGGGPATCAPATHRADLACPVDSPLQCGTDAAGGGTVACCPADHPYYCGATGRCAATADAAAAACAAAPCVACAP